jgi:hypothetical protein
MKKGGTMKSGDDDLQLNDFLLLLLDGRRERLMGFAEKNQELFPENAQGAERAEFALLMHAAFNYELKRLADDMARNADCWKGEEKIELDKFELRLRRLVG